MTFLRLIMSYLADRDDANNKLDLGTHALLGVSVAACQPRAFTSNQPLYNLFNGLAGSSAPSPCVNVTGDYLARER